MSLSKIGSLKTRCSACEFEADSSDILNTHQVQVHKLRLFKCNGCGRWFTELRSLRRHENNTCSNVNYLPSTSAEVPPPKKSKLSYECGKCNKVYTRLYNKNRHENNCTGIKPFDELKCQICNKTFQRRYTYFNHIKKCIRPGSLAYEPTSKAKEKTTESSNEHKEVIEVSTAYKSRLKTFCLTGLEENNGLKYLNDKKQIVKQLLEDQLLINKCMKINFHFKMDYINTMGDIDEKNFKTKNVPVFAETNLDDVITKSYEKIETEMSEFQGKGSGWSAHKIIGLEVRINKFNPLKGSSFIQLPSRITKKGVINVNNNDDRCFLHAIHANDNNKHFHKEYDYSMLSFPTELSSIRKFEKANNISINVYALNNKEKIYPILVCDNELDDHRDLLFLREKNGNSHYCLITDLAKLVSKQVSAAKVRKYICKRCLTVFTKNGEARLAEHKKTCNKRKFGRITMPDLSNYILRFKNVEHVNGLPVVIYADFESVLRKYSTCMPEENKSSTTNVQQHEALSYCLKVVTDEKSLKSSQLKLLPKNLILYRKEEDNDSVGKHFMQDLRSIAFKVQQVYAQDDPMIPLSEEENIYHKLTNECYMCKKPIMEKRKTGNYKVRDHDHLTGKYRGPAHRYCNLNNKRPKILPVIFHGLSNYDSHHIIRSLGDVYGRVNIIPHTEEKFISFSKTIGNIELRFIDSFRFLASKLETLAHNLDEKDFTHLVNFTKSLSGESTQEMFNLLRRKGVYPYDYTDCLEKLNEQKLPDIESFNNLLYESGIKQEEYDHAQNVWKKFNIKTLGEYHDLYLKTDVVLLCDIFEAFRNLCLEHYNLDPVYYYTLPGFAWDAALKFTGVTLELLTDYDQLLLFEEGIRGGITQCVKRYSKANNKDVPGYDPEKEHKYIVYYDANNLYGTGMLDKLPVGEFTWYMPENIEEILCTDDNSDYGYLLDVNVLYPQNLHDDHKDFPFLSEKMCPPNSKNKKLIPNLSNKTHYVVHYRALKQAVKNGLVVTKINKCIRFKQTNWLASYINKNTELRKQAVTEFAKALFKLLNNAVFGKTMEQVRNRLNIHLAYNEKSCQYYVNKPNFIDRTIINENIVTFHLAKENITMNKPLYVGQAILDISKVIMYDFHYDVMKPYFKDNISILYIDTDAYISEIKTNDWNNDLKQLLDHFDTSDYEKTHVCYSAANKKKLGKFKDETCGIPIKEFVGLRPKMYAYQLADFAETLEMKAKGIKKYAVKSKFTFEDYKSCLFDGQEFLTSFYTLRSSKHNIYTQRCVKKSLCNMDDKRLVLDDNIHTLPYGHYSLIHEMSDLDLLIDMCNTNNVV